jgi:hypothetical protein
MIEFTPEQIKAMAERAITVLVTILLAKMVRFGWLSDSDSAALLPFMVILPSLAYAWWVNRSKALARSAASIPGTVVITQPGIASSTMESNIVSNVDATVVHNAETVTTPGVVVQQSSKGTGP